MFAFAQLKLSVRKVIDDHTRRMLFFLSIICNLVILGLLKFYMAYLECQRMRKTF